MARKPPRVVTNVLWNWTSYGLKVAVAFYITPLLIGRLGDTPYGVWILLSSILGYYGLLNFGIDSALVHYVSKYLAEDNRQDIGKVLRTSQVVFFIIAAGVALLSFVLGAAFAYSDLVFRTLFNLSEDLRRPFALLLVVLSLGMAASFYSRVSVSVLRARERFDVLNAIEIAMLIARTLAIVFLMGESLLALGVIFAVSSVLMAFGFWLAARWVWPADSRDNEPLFDAPTFRALQKFGLFSFLNSLADQVRFYTDSLVIGQFMRIRFITYYNLAAVLITYFRNFIGHAASPFFPVFSRYHGANDVQALRQTFLRASKVLAFLAVLAAGNLMGSALPFLRLWVGGVVSPEYITLSYRVLLILLLPFTIEMIQSIAVNLIYGTGQHRRLTRLNALEALANLILSIVLVRSYGLLGVAWGTGIPLIVTQLVFVSRIVCRQTGVGTLGYVGRCIVLPVGCGLALGGAQITLHRMMSTTTYWQLSIVALATSLAFVALMLRLYFSRDERRLFREMRTSWMGGEPS
jgi:O-antigen/teichoic acid export membrane protein